MKFGFERYIFREDQIPPSERITTPPPVVEAELGKKLEGEENSERYKEKKVVRVFVARPKMSEQILASFDAASEGAEGNFDDVFFTKVLLAKKNQLSRNPGQIMPVGGDIRIDTENPEKSETAEEAALRKTLQETHVRLGTIKGFDGQIRYILSDPKGKKKFITQEFFFGEIYPTDRAFPIDPEEDKIEGFVEVDLENLADYLIDSDRVYGSFRLEDESIPQDPAVEFVDNRSVESLYDQLEETMWNTEIDKRLSVTKFFLKFMGMEENDTSRFLLLLEGIDPQTGKRDFTLHKERFAEFMRKASCLEGAREALAKAIDFSNFVKEIEPKEQPYVNPEKDEKPKKESSIEAQLRFIYTLVETNHDHNLYLEYAKENPKLAPFVEKIERFMTLLSGEEHGDSFSSSMMDSLRNVEDMSEKELEKFFMEAFFEEGTSVRDVKRRMQYVNSFIQSIVDRAIVPTVGSRYSRDSVSQMNEVSFASLGKLIKKAFAHRDSDIIKGFDQSENSEENTLLKKRLLFEARRKLFFLMAYEAVDDFYDEKVDEGSSPIEDLWKNFINRPGPKVSLSYENDSEGNLQNVVVHPKKEGEGSLRQETIVRRSSENFRYNFLSIVSPRVKTRESTYRKVVVKGMEDPEDIHDIFGRSITVLPDFDNPDYVTQISKRTINIDGQRVDCEDNVVVLDILEKFSRMPGVRIYKYKPTPKPGEKLKSSGAGGGGDVRLAKFYIEFEQDGQVYREEVQIFTPTKEKSAIYYEKQKKEDDRRYFLDRLLDTKSFRSFFELLFPTSLYGEPMHSMRQDSNHRKKNGKAKKELHEKEK